MAKPPAKPAPFPGAPAAPDSPPAGRRAARHASVPQGRNQRLLQLGLAVGGMAASAAASGLQAWARGERPSLGALMLSPDNAGRLAERLSQMRGAVMKLGQLMSMDGQGALPPQFAQLLGGLRDQAHAMPPEQLSALLASQYGADWPARFQQFPLQALAAASIGQVHRVVTRQGQVLALKIQYPGVRASIDSDVDNLALLARTPGLLPAGLDIAGLLARVRAQLHQETDYAAEARSASLYRRRLGHDPVLALPLVRRAHCTDLILATDFAPGVPVDQLARLGLSQAVRDRVAAALCRLLLRELFELRLVQTDPNFGNYLYDNPSGRLWLLDFGATEAVDPARAAQLGAVAVALRDDDPAALRQAALAVGYVHPADPPAQTDGVLVMLHLAGEPLRHRGAYDFAASGLSRRAFEQGRAQFFGDGFARTPPADLVFVQRKIVGTFLLCARLQARVDLRALLDEWL